MGFTDKSFIVVYILLTVYIVLKTHWIATDEEALGERYVDNVHAHIAYVMLFHVLISSVVIFIKPEYMSNFYVIAVNTACSIMFSILYYRTPKTETKKLYGFNTMYLIFASILFADAVMYFENPTYVKAFAFIFAAFLYDVHFYKREDRKKMIFGIILAGAVGGFVLGTINNDFNWVTSMSASTLYTALVLGYMYYDHDTLVNHTPRDTALNLALKYFLDVEGTVVRLSSSYINDSEDDDDSK